MDAERWKHVDRLLEAALARPPDERDTFLRHTCVGDDALEREIRSLLPALPWLFREPPLNRKRLPMIWTGASRRIRSPNLRTYRFFARYRHSSTGMPQTAWSGCTSLCPMNSP